MDNKYISDEVDKVYGFTRLKILLSLGFLDRNDPAGFPMEKGYGCVGSVGKWGNTLNTTVSFSFLLGLQKGISFMNTLEIDE